MGECVSSLCLRQNNEKNDEVGIKNILENNNNIVIYLPSNDSLTYHISFIFRK